MSKNLSEIFGDVIYAYTREQAIEDGELIDISHIAQEAGIKYPVAVARSVWFDYITPDETLEKIGQSSEGRLWDLIWMFRHEAGKNSGSQVKIQLYFLLQDKRGTPIHTLTTLKAICGPGDQGEPVITIMKPNED